MDKLYSILNICGISGRCSKNLAWYIDVLNTIFNQYVTSFKHKVVLSACCSDTEVLTHLKKIYPDLSIFAIKDKIPVNPSFNYSVLKSVELFGAAKWYSYIDSGIKFTNEHQLEQLVDLARSGPYSMVASSVDDDGGYDQWFGSTELPGTEDMFIIPVGKCLNLHLQLFDHTLLAQYNALLPDIFAGHCSESVLSFLAAAIRTNWVVAKKVVVSHRRDVDGQSAGFDPAKWVQQGQSRYDHPFIVNSIFERVFPGQAIGLGYEGDLMKHDVAQYDENGFCKHKFLKEYIKENLFLQQSEFDYNQVNANFL